MKKIINGKMYDIEKAKKLGRGYSTLPKNDFGYWQEDLYITKSGVYFLHGEGGPASKYSVASGSNSWSGGEEIIPISTEESMEWAEKNLEAGEYIEIFGQPEEA